MRCEAAATRAEGVTDGQGMTNPQVRGSSHSDKLTTGQRHATLLPLPDLDDCGALCGPQEPPARTHALRACTKKETGARRELNPGPAAP